MAGTGRGTFGDPASERVVAVAPGTDTATPLATTQRPVEALGVRVRLSPAGYEIRGGRPRPSPRRGRNRTLLGAPFDASA